MPHTTPNNDTRPTLLIYGATGYTGKLIAHYAKDQRLSFIIAGQNEAKVAALAQQLDVPYRVFSIDDREGWRRGLAGITCLLNAAGPFSQTARQAMDACVEHRVHYLDITAEYRVFELAQSYDQAARAAGIMLLSGVGMMVSIDSLAFHATRRVAQPVKLRLGFKHHGSFSRGTILTSAGSADVGVVVRRDGALVPVADPQAVHLDFGNGPETCFPSALGGTILAYKSTGVPNIEEFFQVQLPLPVMETDISKIPEGPSAEERASGREKLFAEVTNADGTLKVSVLDGPSGYTLTYLSAVEVAKHVLAGDYRVGFQSAAAAYGDQLLHQIPGVKVLDL